uniref:Putative ionotropic receptor 10a n=1 Tax=Lutzomyia longipalpis TaxID=7200 RepID=A0A1B0CQV0_LUTLO
MDNGTVTGTLGDVVYKKTDLSFNNRFVMKYKSDVEFLYAIMTDQFCLFAPKAQLKPKWLAIFKCFTVDVWSLFVVVNLICGFVRYGIKCWEELLRWRKGKTHPLSRILFETWNIMMSSPSILLPRRSAERSFVGFCLLMNVIFTGTFQGSLVTSISTPTSYKDMNTMQEVDESGLLIFMPSEGFMDIFGDGGSKVLESLKSKMRFREREEFDRVIADDRPVFISRMSDSTLNIEREYTKPDGTPAYHVVKECPRNYHMSYIVRRGWAFSTLFNTILSRLREAGFINMWYKSTENAILMHKRITDRRQNSLKPFNLEDMQTAFFILVLGLTGCTFISKVAFSYATVVYT